MTNQDLLDLGMSPADIEQLQRTLERWQRLIEAECEGHPAGPYEAMGETVYCDGSCRVQA